MRSFWLVGDAPLVNYSTLRNFPRSVKDKKDGLSSWQVKSAMSRGE